MTKKFLLVRRSRAPEIIFAVGERYHEEIVQREHLKRSQIMGGGYADQEHKRIYGTSKAYGPYDQETVQNLLPDWNVLPPSK